MTANLNMTLHSIHLHYYYVNSFDPWTHHTNMYKQQRSWHWRKNKIKSLHRSFLIVFFCVTSLFSEELEMSNTPNATVLDALVLLCLRLLFLYSGLLCPVFSVGVWPCVVIFGITVAILPHKIIKSTSRNMKRELKNKHQVRPAFIQHYFLCQKPQNILMGSAHRGEH